MTIPMKYEDVVAKLETERARITDYISQRAQTELLLEAALGREAALEISLGHEVVAVGHLQGELVIWKTKACEAAEREAALREELELVRKAVPNSTRELVSLQQRLTVAEQLLRETLPHLRFCKGMGQKFSEKLDGLDLRIEAVIKPAAEGEGS